MSCCASVGEPGMAALLSHTKEDAPPAETVKPVMEKDITRERLKIRIFNPEICASHKDSGL